jgi:hypothetical protein
LIPSTSKFKALVCITSCRRLGVLRRYLPHYAGFCESDPRYSLLVSLDGTEAPYLDFCRDWDLALLYSDEREGVGLSKNRALEQFPDFDYYFFIEDDVELVDDSVFSSHVDLAARSGIHHFSLFEHGGVRKPVGETMVAGRRVVHALFGAADFNFFTRAALKRVGGWHPLFARYRRWGHTEHSYRFPRADLAPAPFNVAVELIDAFAWHSPPAVTRVEEIELDEDQISRPERELMDQELDLVPVQTLSAYHLQGTLGRSPTRLASIMSEKNRYPLAGPRERREARSDFLLWQSTRGGSFVRRAATFLAAFGLWPKSPAIRHEVKTWLGRWRRSPRRA